MSDRDPDYIEPFDPDDAAPEGDPSNDCTGEEDDDG